jgi:hypothetical protein
MLVTFCNPNTKLNDLFFYNNNYLLRLQIKVQHWFHFGIDFSEEVFLW